MKNAKLKPFDDLVELRYFLYNSLFLTLPFSNLSKYGKELPLFAERCRQKLESGDDPFRVIEDFFSQTLEIEDENQRAEIMFLFLQLVERQVLLFDAVERSASKELVGEKIETLLSQLKVNHLSKKSLRIVLTAHPTQFYPEALLGLIKDLTESVKKNDAGRLRKLLLQLGRTSFRNPIPPTPLEEAEMLIDQFGVILYEVFVDLSLEWKEDPPCLELGFWPGGDRDGNPLVTSEITRQVCERLRTFAKNRLFNMIERLRRRITFKGLTKPILDIRTRLLKDEFINKEEMADELRDVLEKVDRNHGGLFREEVVRVIRATSLFGLHFASLDLRENSEAIGSVLGTLESRYPTLSCDEKLKWLESEPIFHEKEHDLISTLKLVPEVQKRNGPLSLHRFIISHTESTLHLMEIFYLSEWYAKGLLDVVPLFESIADMRKAPEILENLFQNKTYLKHLQKRKMKQTVMLGFSDGTKDGGYVTCNWEIQQCKESLMKIAKIANIDLIFFDGRGGPPARGGGSTHKYYASVAEKIPLNEIQLTVQGQSISSYYGSYDLAKYNLLELLASFLQAKRPTNVELLEELSRKAYKHYLSLKNDPKFIPLLMETTPLKFLGELNIASRPPKRVDGKPPSLENLRAISFVSSWSLMKINLPAFYGFGLSLEEMIHEDKLEPLKNLYSDSMYFRVLIGNAVQAIRKSYLPLTLYTEFDPEFGSLWKLLREELSRTKENLLKVAGQAKLEMDDPLAERSVSMREEIVLPLLVIQHFALMRLRQDPENSVWKKLLLKSIPPSINASRNSA